MKRSRLKRDTEAAKRFANQRSKLQRSPMSRGRKTRVKAVNRERKKRRQQEGEVYGPFHRWVSGKPCIVRSELCWGTVAGHHLKSVGSGGKDADGEVPLCSLHHAEIHQSTARFEARHKVSVRDAANRLLSEYGTPDEE